MNLPRGSKTAFKVLRNVLIFLLVVEGVLWTFRIIIALGLAGAISIFE